MTKNIMSSVLGLILWMSVSWFFYLGYSSDIVAVSMFFIPAIAGSGFSLNARPNHYNFLAIALIVCYLGLGVGIYEVLGSLGGLSYFASLLFENQIVMVATNVIFALHVYSKFDVGDTKVEQAIV
jgi:hypothetical protein